MVIVFLYLSDVVCDVSVSWRLVDSIVSVFLFQAEDGIRDLVRSRGLGDVYKRQDFAPSVAQPGRTNDRVGGRAFHRPDHRRQERPTAVSYTHLTLPTSDLV